MAEPCIALNTGAKMPLIAFGTLMGSLQADHDGTVRALEDALEVGYRHMDCATVYNTETHVGEAMHNKQKQGLLTREDVFITTKLWRNAYSCDDVVPALKESLQRLGMDYVDLYLIHWPTAFKSGEERFPKDDSGKFIYADTDYLDTWKGMEKCYELGLAKAIGLSNFNSKQIRRILDNCKIRPANNQIESHPYLTNTKIVEFCQSKGITITAYAPLAGFNPKFREKQGWPTIYTDNKIREVAAKHGKTPAQIALRYQLERQVCVAPKSAKKERMIENFSLCDFSLDSGDMKVLNDCNQGYRLNAEFPDHPHYPFHEEF